MTPSDILALIREKNIKMVDFRIVDLPGRQHHLTVPAAEIDEEKLTHGIAFDGSSLQGFRSIEESDMVMRPDLATAYVDAFTAVPTLEKTRFTGASKPGTKRLNELVLGVAKARMAGA